VGWGGTGTFRGASRRGVLTGDGEGPKRKKKVGKGRKKNVELLRETSWGVDWGGH